MQDSYDYRGFHLLYCWYTDVERWHIFLRGLKDELIHVGPEDLASRQDAKDHIDTYLLFVEERLEADAFGEYIPCQ